MNVLPPVPLSLKDTVTTVTPLAPASHMAMEQFNAVMQAAAPSGTTPGSAVPATAVPETTQPIPHGPLSLGNQILGSLQKSSNDVSGRWQSISAQLDQTSATPNVTELLQVQAQLLQVSVHYELVGKVISKSTQNIDTMVRMQ